MDFSPDSLEYDRLKTLLGRFVSGQPARDLLSQIAPSTDLEDLESRHAHVAEAMEYLREHTVSFPDIPALPAAMARLGPGGITLEIPEIEAFEEFLADIGSLRSEWAQSGGGFPLLRSAVQRLPDLQSLCRLLGQAVRAGEIREEFSPGLRRIRRELEVGRSRLNRKLQVIVAERSPQLQDSIVTVRNGRYVIPVRAEQQRRVAGIVHGSSSSGATVFVEPLETLEMNNDLVRFREEEEREVRRILGDLTDRIQECRDPIAVGVRVRAELELLFGIARWGRDFDCTRPHLSGARIRLRRARHPLLQDRLKRSGQSVVPVSLEMEQEDRVLVISGPNAGGKTVVLKTIGLLALMAQSGIPVPAEEAVLPVSDRILADIGDQQSISNQLSTFSAHVLAISQMVDSAGARSLILLDEIGSSTEPAEGAALAIAVLEHFRKVGARAVATTHYNRLKMYAETRPGVRNAAMEFREDTLEPTYRLIQGLAGHSSGLKIAGRLLHNEDLLKDAWAQLDRSELDAARFVEELRDRISRLEAEKGLLEDERREFEAWKRQMEADLAAEREARLGDLEARLDEIVLEIRRRAEDSLRAGGPDAVTKVERVLDRARGEARRTLERELGLGPSKSVSDSGGPASAANVSEGTRVRVSSLGIEGIVLAVREGHAEVSVGRMKMQRPFEDLEILGAAELTLPKNVHFEAAARAVTGELNIIGCDRDEAIARLDKFLDDSFLSGFPSVRIIHGFGKGILRRAVREFLESHPHVAALETASAEQGGRGATIATLNA